MRCVLHTALVVIIVLFTGAVVAAFLHPKNLDKGMLSGTAIVACAHLRTACEAYRLREANEKHEWPRNLRDLVHPPFGGASLLEDGANCLIDPWGKPYMLSISTREDGSPYALIWTVNHEGLLISQHGIGPKARPQKTLTK